MPLLHTLIPSQHLHLDRTKILQLLSIIVDCQYRNIDGQSGTFRQHNLQLFSIKNLSVRKYQQNWEFILSSLALKTAHHGFSEDMCEISRAWVFHIFEDVVIGLFNGLKTVELGLLEITVDWEALLHLFASVRLRVLHFSPHCKDRGAMVCGVVDDERWKGLKRIQVTATALSGVMGGLVVVMMLDARRKINCDG